MSLMKKKYIRFIEFENKCIVPINFTLNADGYYRRQWVINGERVQEMFHRFIWRAHNNVEQIPAGYEINHKLSLG
jgi:hypothetical protein